METEQSDSEVNLLESEHNKELTTTEYSTTKTNRKVEEGLKVNENECVVEKKDDPIENKPEEAEADSTEGEHQTDDTYDKFDETHDKDIKECNENILKEAFGLVDDNDEKQLTVKSDDRETITDKINDATNLQTNYLELCAQPEDCQSSDIDKHLEKNEEEVVSYKETGESEGIGNINGLESDEIKLEERSTNIFLENDTKDAIPVQCSEVGENTTTSGVDSEPVSVKKIEDAVTEYKESSEIGVDSVVQNCVGEDGVVSVEGAEVRSEELPAVVKDASSDVTIWHPLLDLGNDDAAHDIKSGDLHGDVTKKGSQNLVVGNATEGEDVRETEVQDDRSKTVPLVDGDNNDQEPNAEIKKKEKTPLVELAEKGMGMADILTETGEFAYISLVAVALATTFSDQWHKTWKDNYIRVLCKHLKTKRGIEKTMVQFLHEDLKPLHANAYVEILKDDWMIKDNPSIIAQDLLGITIEKGDYDARSRVIIYHIAKLMAVPSGDVDSFEDMIVESFVQEEVIESEEQKAEKAKRSKQTKVKRYLAIGAATVGGGALIGLTGGLAAPLLASAGVALFGSGAAFLGTTAGLAIMASMFGAAGAGLGGYKMKRRVGAIEEFEFASLGKGKDLHVVIAVSGWLTRDRLDNFTVPWLALAESKEQYTLKWESKYLKNLGDGLEYIMDSVMTMAAKEALKYTVLAGLLAAITLPAAAYGALSALDNPWSIVTRRSVETGKELAEVLLKRLQGKRPVTLIGFSMGARVIFSALQELSVRKGSEGIIENVILLGAPITSSVKSWQPLEKVVSGRIINGYCRGDWLLQFVYRAASVQVTNIAGLGPVNWDNRLMENIDLTDIVDGHLDYSEKIDEILAHIGLKTIPRSASPILQEPGLGAAKAKEELKVDVGDLLLPKSQKVAEISEGVPRSGSANSYLYDYDKKSEAGADICKSASFPQITVHEGQSEHQRVPSEEDGKTVRKKSEAGGVVEVGCEPTH